MDIIHMREAVMAIETKRPISRRSLLAAVAGGVAAAAAGTLAGAQRALASGSDGESVVIGEDYADIRSPTTFTRTKLDRDILRFRGGGPATDVVIANDRIRASDGDGNASIAGDGISVTHSPPFGGGSTTTARIGSASVDLRRTPHHGAPGRTSTLKPDGLRTDGTVEAVTTTGTRAIIGGAPNGHGVRGWGRRGGHFAGSSAQIRLKPSDRPSHPESGKRGDLFVDASGRLWYCKGGTAWRKLVS